MNFKYKELVKVLFDYWLYNYTFINDEVSIQGSELSDYIVNLKNVKLTKQDTLTIERMINEYAGKCSEQSFEAGFNIAIILLSNNH